MDAEVVIEPATLEGKGVSEGRGGGKGGEGKYIWTNRCWISSS